MAKSTYWLVCVFGYILAAASTTQGAITFGMTHTVVFDSQQKCLATTTGRIPELMLTTPAWTVACAARSCVETPAGSSSVFVTTTCSSQDSAVVTSSANSFFDTFPTYFFTGTNNFPYVTVEKYPVGNSCLNAGSLLSKTLYLTDAKCHKTNDTFSYRSVVGYGGQTVTVTTFTDSTCSTGKATIVDTTTPGVCGSPTATRGLFDTRIYSSSWTFLYLSSTASYDSKEGDCKSPAVPTQLVTSVVPVDTCSATTSCSVTGDVYAGVSCSSAYTYKTDWAAMFGSNAYFIVEKYATGTYCADHKLLGATVYLADGKCHQTTTMSSFRVTKDLNALTTIKTYADSSTCGGTGVTLSYASTQLQNSCANDAYGILDMKLYGYGTTIFYLTLKVSYETKVGDCKSPAVPSQIVIASKDVVDACVPVPTCAGTVVPFSSTVCSTPATYHADAIALYGVYPFVTLEKYAPSSCKAPQLSSITTYFADGKCHKISDSSSYRSTRAADGSATVTTYSSTSYCGTSGSLVTITAAQALGNSCLNDVNGIVDTKVYGNGVTPFYLLITVKYETNTGDCKSPVLPALLSAAIVAVDSCTATTTCTGTAPPYSSIACSSTLSFRADTAAVFGKNPYLVVERYLAGQNCDATKLSSISAYLADGKCHKTGNSASYVATRASDGFGVIKTFADSTSCATTGTILTVPSANSTCILAGVSDVKIYGDGNTPVYLSSIISYDTITNTCAPPAVPTLLSASVVSGENCVVALACSGTVGPFSKTTCGSTQSFKTDTAAVFGSNPYLVVEKYVAGQACNLTKLSDITVYVADGKCRKTSETSSYVASRAADASAIIKLYADSSSCATTGATISVTAAQTTGNTCIVSTTGLADIKSYGDGKTPLVTTSTMLYDSNSGGCKWPAVPTQVVPALVSADVCTTSTGCSGTADPYSGTKCSSILTRKEDIAAAFGANPFLAVEKYVAGGNCNPAEILGTTAYLADGKCHKTGASASYAATRAADGSAVIATYAESAVCVSTAMTVAVTAAQGRDNTCVSTANAGDIKCYGDGRSPMVFFSTLSYDTKAGDCKWPVIPTKLVATLVPNDACAASRSCSGAVDSYSATSCSSTLSLKSNIAAAFGSSPYVVVEKYQPGFACDPTKLSGIEAYLADDKCHKTTGSASESYAAIRAADGSALIKTYADSSTCASQGVTTTVTAARAAGDCIPSTSSDVGDIKSYGGGSTPTIVVSAMKYDTSVGGCKWPVVPTQIESLVVASDACTISSTCSGETMLYSATKCSNLLTWKEDMATVFGSSPYVVVERYVGGQNCDSKAFAGMATYLADGKCHMIDNSTSYLATRMAGGSAAITTYVDSSTCATAGSTLRVTAAQSINNVCTPAIQLGIGDVKVYGDGFSPLYVGCSSLNVDGCEANTMRTEVFARVVSDRIFVGLNISGLTTPVIDGECRTTDLMESVEISKTTGSATIRSYPHSATCSGNGISTTVTIDQVLNGAACTAVGLPGAVTSGANGSAPEFLLSTVSYDTNAGDCKKPAVPAKVSTSILSSDSCVASSACSGSADSLFSSTSCSNFSTYRDDIAASFGLTPYVIVENYAGGSRCGAGSLLGITTYAADGKCHPTNVFESFRVSISVEGSVTISSYTSSRTCSGSPFTIIVDTKDPSCISVGNGFPDLQVVKMGKPRLYLSSTVSYDANFGPCELPTQVSTTVLAMDTCAASNKCTKSKTGQLETTTCTTPSSHRAAMRSTFGSTAYLIVEKYATGKRCDALALAGITTYVADGKCHKSGTTSSFRATRMPDRSATIVTYTDSATCDTTGSILSVTAEQATSNSCADDGDGIPDMKLYGDGVTPMYFSSTVNYDVRTGGCKAPTVPARMVTTVVSGGSCAASTTCTGSTVPYSGTTCGSSLTYKTDVATAFGSTAYMIVETYAAGKNCDASMLTDITTYAADGKCHKSGSTSSFRATRRTDESATIVTYTDSATCGTTGSTLSVTADQASGNSCADDGNGILDTKVYGDGATPLFLSSTVNYDSNTGGCKAPTVPARIVATVVTGGSCVASTACTGTAVPYSATTCGSLLTYKAGVATAFGSTAYVIVEKYSAGKNCDASMLTDITTYVADGKCHKSGSTSSFRATRRTDESATIVTYTDSATCGTTGSALSVTADQVLRNSCADDGNGILDTKVYGDGATPLFLSSTVNYDSNTGGCKSPTVPASMVATVVTGGSCVASTACTGTAIPYSGTACGSSLTYKAGVAKAFGSIAYVIVEKYAAGKGCDASTLTGITTYVADGKCHKSGTTSSFRTTRMPDKSATIVTYTDSTCGTTGSTLSVTADQASGNSCTADSDGIPDTKVYGDGVTPFFLSSTVNYDSSTGGCKSPTVPASMEMTVVSSDTCVETTTCTGSTVPYSGTTCGSSLTYKTDVATAFGSTAYVIVETYAAGKNCDASMLTGITTYVADSKCHKSGTTSSFRATRRTDESATIVTYTDSATCGTTGSTLSVTADQASGNSCADDGDGIPDTKVYGDGATPLFLSSTVNYDSNTGGCKSPTVPASMEMVVLVSDTCVASTTCTGMVAPYSGTACGTSLTYKTDVATAYGSTAYVIVEKYTTGTSCDASTLTGITTYVADGMCHKSGTTSSFRTTRKTDGSATIVTYTNSATCGTMGSTLSVTAGQASGNSCADDGNGISDTKLYGDGVTPLFFWSTVSYDSNTGGCKSPTVPARMVTTVLSRASCVPSTTCTGSTVPYSGTACGTSLTYKTDVATAFGSIAYVIVEKYAAGKGCDASTLTGITTYVADGKCHKSGTTSSFRTTRMPDKSATIVTYTDSTCGTTGSTLSVTADQASGNSCTADSDGIPDTKLYGDGVTPFFLSSTVNYDSSTGGCKAPTVPARMVTTVLSKDSCLASTVCTGSTVPYNGTACGTSLTYKTDVATAFGSIAYVIVEKYAVGKGCDASMLTGITTYVADSKCHKSGTTFPRHAQNR